MPKNLWLVTLMGLLLAGTLLWAAPGFAQTQGWTCPRGYAPGTGPGWRGGGGPGYCGYYNAQASPRYGYGSGKQARNRNRARWNTPQAPVNPTPQTVPQSSN